jgi:hypothetical protein
MAVRVGEQLDGEQLRGGGELGEAVNDQDGTEGCAGYARGPGIVGKFEGVGPRWGYG